MDDIGSVVIGPAHEVGVWRGPAPGPWLQRIAHGAGFGSQWDINRLADESASGARSGPVIIPASHAQGRPEPDNPTLRLWWLPSARDVS